MRSQTGLGTHNPPAQRIDATDRAILAGLTADGRMSNAALARQVGIAESTCIQRVRALRESGTISGIHADVNLSKVGRPLQAVVHVRLRHNNQRDVRSFHSHIVNLPGLLTAFDVAGGDDYLLHVAVADSDALRDLVANHVSGHPAVSHTETQLVFAVTRGAAPGLT